jgi:protein-L-isoaspartate O-methyltransferase
MQPQKLTIYFRLFLLVSVALLSVTANGQQLNERFPNELNSDIEEPRIALPEVQSRSRFRTVSRSRQKSNDSLIELCKESVDTTARRLLSTESHTPWQIMHGLLALRHDFQIQHEGQSISGLDWVAQGQVFDGEYWFESTRHGGRAHPYSRPYAFEGHANQFLAILSMCGVELDRKFGTSTGQITMRDMINNAQKTLKETDEPTWTLWALSRYLPSSARWHSDDGAAWSIEKLVQDQTAKPMQGAPCGGTHALFALAHARNVYLRQRKPLRGVWLQAEYKIRKHINTARIQQNADGTLSSNFFRSKEHDPDFNKRMASAGHILEFLMIALPQNELGERWVRRAIEATARDLLNNRKAYVKCSPLYHSVNALNIYLDRVNPTVPVDKIASGRKKARTAKLTPRKKMADEPKLKSVPVTRITKSRQIPETKPTESIKTKAEESVPKKEQAAEAEKTTPIAVQFEPLREGPAPAVPPAADTTPQKVITDNNQAKWKATPKKRRTATSDDAANVDGQDQSDKASDPSVENKHDAAEDQGNDDETAAQTGETAAQTGEVESQPEDLIETPESEALKRRSEETGQALAPIVTAIGLSEGMSVTEVGSGTGLFLNLLSGQVGANGRVFATDVSPRVVEFLEERVVAEDLTNVDVVCNDGTSLALVNSQVDRVFVCDAFQSFRNHTTMLASIRKNLRPGGELIIVESEQLPESDTNSANGDSGSQTIQGTVEEAGFVYVEDVSIPGLGSGFFLRFRKSAE